MLELDTRTLLLDALRPPMGHRLEIAVGTTFTLDLTALLAVPLAAALRDGVAPDQDPGAADDRLEALDLFETVRRLADRVVVFAQAGMTAVPKRYRPLYACIEDSVVPVRRPRPGRIFHPKLWALRFRRESGEVHHRVVVLTRNLTFDRSWDVMVTADEEPDAERAFDTTGLLAALGALPRLTNGRADQLALLDDLVTTLAPARLPLPPRAQAGEFVPLGWNDDSTEWPFDDQCRDALVVSPFLTSKSADRFLRTATHGATAVSRPAAFDEVAGFLPSGATTLVPLPESEPSDDGLDPTTLQGLHAKVYVQDRRGGPYSMWIGSANLTDAALGGNAELLVRINGERSEYGTAAVLGTERADRKLGLRDLLTDYCPGGDVEPEPEDGVLQGLGIDIAAAGVHLTVQPSVDVETWDVVLQLGHTLPDLELDARLLTLPAGLPIHGGAARWTGLATPSITPYVVLGLVRGDRRHEVLVRAELDGDPGHRRSAVLASCMSSPEDFLRYVLALLGEDDPVTGSDDGAWAPAAMGAWLDPERILESLLLAASRSPERLGQLERLITELERTERGRGVIPNDFRAVWEPVWAAAGDSA